MVYRLTSHCFVHSFQRGLAGEVVWKTRTSGIALRKAMIGWKTSTLESENAQIPGWPSKGTISVESWMVTALEVNSKYSRSVSRQEIWTATGCFSRSRTTTAYAMKQVLPEVHD